MKKILSGMIAVLLIMQSSVNISAVSAEKIDTVISVDDLYDWRRDTVISVDDLYEGATVSDMYYEFGDTQAVKLYADRYDFSQNWALNSEISYNSRKTFSGWDSDEVGGRISIDGNSLLISDSSNAFPVSMVKRIERATYGVLTLSFRTKIHSYADGFSWTMADGNTDAVAICTSNNAFYLRQPNNQMLKLGDVVSGVENGFVVKADIDNGKVDVYLNGELVAEKKDILNEVEGIDQFSIASSKVSVGSFDIPSVSLERGYAVREYFETQTNNLLSDLWTDESLGGSISCKSVVTNVNNDFYNLVLDSKKGKAVATRYFKEEKGNTVVEFKQYIPAKRNGVNVEIRNNNNVVLKINSDNGFFSVTGENTQQFYSYLGNIWYTFRIVMNIQENKADIYLNGKKKLSNVPFSGTAVNNISFSSEQNSSAVEYDDILVYNDSDDYNYIPEPVIPAKKSNVAVGMQVCPIWKEGTSLGWEYVRHYNERVPYLGFYDEGNPEVSDWEIKWMTEHGIDFTWNCWYRPIDENSNPIKTAPLSSSLMDGYFYAKYSDKVKFAIMFENSKPSYGGADDFKNNIIPYWIEYFFTDERYFTIDGRPVVGVYDYSRLSEQLGGRNGVKACFNYLINECAKRGIGKPIIVVQTFSDNTSDFEKFKTAGFDFVYSYHRNNDSPKTVKEYLNSIKGQTYLNVIPSLAVGFNNRVWGGGQTDSHYGIATADEFAELCTWANETYIPSLRSSGLSKNIVMIDTWNEFGEGTYTMPSELEGFGYLEAVRNAFTAGGVHNDAVPTDEQKDRFNNLYPFTTLKSIKDKNKPPVSTELLKQWSFDNDNDSEGWTAEGNIKDLSVNGGVLAGTLTGDNPCIKIENINIPIRDVKYLKIRIKNKTASNNGKVIFKTNKAKYSDYTSISFNVNYGDAQFQDIYVPVYANSMWSGELTGLKIIPCLSGNKLLSASDKNEFYIDEISLVKGNGQDMISGAQILLNGTPIDCSSDLIIEDGVPYISSGKFQNLLNMIYSFDDETQTAIFVRDDGTLTMKIDEGAIYKDGTKASFVGGAIIRHETVYVHYKAFTLYNYIVSYDKARQLVILRNPWYGNGYDDIVPNEFAVNNLIDFGKFNDAANLNYVSGDVAASIVNGDTYEGSGALKLTSSQGNQYAKIKVAVKPNRAYCLSVYAKSVSGAPVLSLKSDNLRNLEDNKNYVSKKLTGSYTKCNAVFEPDVKYEQEVEIQIGLNVAAEVIVDNMEFYEMPYVYQNAVIGGTFESGSDINDVIPCYNDSTTTFEITETEPIYNDKSLYVSTTKQNNGVAMPAYIIPGETYYLRAAVRLVSASYHETTFALRMSSDISGWQNSVDVNVQKLTEIGRTVTLQGYFTAPAISNNTAYVSVAPWTYADFIVDNIEVIHVRKGEKKDMIIGEFSFYKDYGTPTSQKYRDEQLSSGTWSAVLKNFENLADMDKDITVIVALYKNDENKLVYAKTMNKNFEGYSYATSPIVSTLDVPDISDGEYHVKGFLFDNLNNITSLAEYILVSE